MHNLKFIFFSIFLLLLNSFDVLAQSDKELKVFMDCSYFEEDCHYDYVRQEIPLVNFVRDRLDADVQILLLNRRNNSGANIVSIYFIGYKNFQQKNDTIIYSIPTNAMESEFREELSKAVKNGLHYYIFQKDKSILVDISYKKIPTIKQKPIEDPYNLWVYQMGLTGNVDGSQNNKNLGIDGYFSASRETYRNKNEFFFNYEVINSKFIDADDKIYNYRFQKIFTNYTYAYRLNEHWAVGLEPGFLNSLYANQKYRYWLDFNLEYSVFPYSQFNTSRLVISTEITPKRIHYYDTTIYMKMREAFVTNHLNAIYSYTQPWGSVNVGSYYNVMLNDFSKYSISLSGALIMKLFKGLNFAVWGNYTKVNNQINIRKGDASIDQLLIKNREILSAYNYEFKCGFTYRFGSERNDAINPIFRGLSYSINL